ncbi:MAG: DUF1554 domain-containing protein [Burkholderiales bacterium]|nr:DUF1554 domain-containing protein [Burkholderiales bacterium]
MHQKFSKLISNGALITSALVVVPLAISACSGGSSNGGNNTTDTIGTINGHAVQLSAGNFSVNPRSDAPVGSIAIPGMSTSESPITLTFANPAPPAPQASFNPTPCIITASTPSCAVVINGSNAPESSYTYSVAYSISGSTLVSLPGTMQVTTSNSIPEVRAGTLSISVENQLTVESTEQATITLSNSTGVNSLPVTVVADNSKITLSASTCNLSTASNTCNVTVTAGNESGNTTLVASANGYTSANKAITVNPQPAPPPANKWVFVSQSSPNGAMVVANSVWQPTGANGIAKADAICQHDAESAGWVPNDLARSLTWKAMIAGTSRSAKPSPIDWVFDPDTTYIDIISNLTIGTAKPDATFAFPLSNVWGYGNGYNWSAYGNTLGYWTGLDGNWDNASFGDCNNWGDAGTFNMTSVGIAVAAGAVVLGQNAIMADLSTCDRQDTPVLTALRLVCVSQ